MTYVSMARTVFAVSDKHTDLFLHLLDLRWLTEDMLAAGNCNKTNGCSRCLIVISGFSGVENVHKGILVSMDDQYASVVFGDFVVRIHVYNVQHIVSA